MPETVFAIIVCAPPAIAMCFIAWWAISPAMDRLE